MPFSRVERWVKARAEWYVLSIMPGFVVSEEIVVGG